MTHIRSALVAGMLVIGGALVASAQAPVQTPVPQARQQDQHARGQHARGQHAKGQRRMGARGRGDPALKGLTLSAAEKANVKAVREKYASQFKALRSAAKSDTLRAQAMKIRQAERADLRGALSAENQAKFDANVTQMKQHMGRRGQRKAQTKPGV